VLPSLLSSTKPNRYLDKLTPAHLRPVALFGRNVAISGLKDTAVVLSWLLMIGFLVGEAKPWVGSEWLVSSSKLQHCLKLCQFTQTLLKTKVVR
jgi:hypothetical protein